MPAVRFLTDFADQAVVLPLAAAVLLGLLALGWRQGALAWSCGVVGVLALMLVLKLAAFACGGYLGLADLGWLSINSPSGHTAAAAVVYGGLFTLLTPRSVAGTAVAALAGGSIALLFGLTRLVLQVHTLGDVLTGAAVGVAGAMVMRHLAGPRPALLASPRLLLVACVVMLVFHGHRLEAETRIRWLALDVWPLSACHATTIAEVAPQWRGARSGQMTWNR